MLENEATQSLLQGEEKDLKSKVPEFLSSEVSNLKPSKAYSNYTKTGNEMFKIEAEKQRNELKSKVEKIAGTGLLLGAIATPRGRSILGKEVIQLGKNAFSKLLSIAEKKIAKEAVKDTVKAVEKPVFKSSEELFKGLVTNIKKPFADTLPIMEKPIVVDSMGNYDRKAFENYLDKIPTDYIPVTHETTKEVAEQILKGKRLGGGDDIFASLGFRESPNFVKTDDAVRVLVDIPKSEIDISKAKLGTKYAMGLDTMDHGINNPFMGEGSHVTTPIKNEWIKDIIDINGNSLMDKNKGSAKVKPLLATAGATAAGVSIFGSSNKTSYEKIKEFNTDTPEDSIVTDYSGLKLGSPYEGEFTMYNPEARQTDNTPNILASGKHIDEAITKDYDVVIAAGNRSIPLGTIVQIPELGVIGIVEDRMNKRYDKKDQYNFDILVKDKNEAINFGRQKLTFKVLGHDDRVSTKVDLTNNK